MSKHTPGPWKVWSNKFIHRKNEVHVTQSLAKVYHQRDANIIAASPEMYELLKKSLDATTAEEFIDIDKEIQSLLNRIDNE